MAWFEAAVVGGSGYGGGDKLCRLLALLGPPHEVAASFTGRVVCVGVPEFSFA